MRIRLVPITINTVFCILVLLIYGIGAKAQSFYIVGMYIQARPADGEYDTIKPQYIQSHLFKMDSQNMAKFSNYCRGKNFDDFYTVHNFINPDSVQSLELYTPYSNDWIHTAMFNKFGKKDYSKPIDPIPYMMRIDSSTSSIENVLLFFKVEYSDNVLFVDTDCYDYNSDRAGMRRRNKIPFDSCPEFYLNLDALNPKLVNTIYLK